MWKGWLYRTFPCLSDFIVFRNVTEWYHYFFLAYPEITVENGLPKLGYLLTTLKYHFFLDIRQDTRNKFKNHFTLWHASVAKLIVAPFSWDKAGSTGPKFRTASSKKYVFFSFDSNFVEVVSRSYQKLICKNVSGAVAWFKSWAGLAGWRQSV